jgi:hypothetical protein
MTRIMVPDLLNPKEIIIISGPRCAAGRKYGYDAMSDMSSA